MQQEKISQLTDQELLEEAKKLIPSPIINAGLIGIMIGVIIYSIVRSSVGLFTLIPLFFVYRLFNDSKKYDAMKREIEERKLE